MSIKSVNALSHYTDWTIGHVHGGALGWNGFIAFGMIYWLIPRLWKVEVWSKSLMAAHFWLGTIGIVLYITSMWVGGVTQGLMWRAFTPEGTLKYPEFVETVVHLIPFYWIRLIGGLMYLVGVVISAYNIIKTIQASKAQGADLSDVSVQAMALPAQGESFGSGPFHHILEGKTFIFTILALVAVVVGSLAEIIPLISVQTNVKQIASVHPYTPLELEGRDLYVREGCYNCHSQMVRTLRDEVVRYGEYSKAGEFVYDHPFQFGSKRTGPDLHRVGGKYNDFWHYNHMRDPRSTTAGSIMPGYPWLYDNDLDTSLTSKKLAAMKKLGVPYSEDEIQGATTSLETQASQLTSKLYSEGVPNTPGLEKKEIIALIAYMQRLGADIKGGK
jgi:cytochrome c oxidase cbb3-type subunit I/II